MKPSRRDIPRDESHLATKQRLLEAAGEVFAEVGFRAATIRDICRRADNANVASVNYHFGGKEHLYSAVVSYAHRCALAQYPCRTEGTPACAGERLAEFVRSFMLRMLDAGRPAWEGKLISREMIDPSSALDAVVEEGVKPQLAYLISLVRQIAGVELPEEELRSAAHGIIGQCVFYRHAQPVLQRLDPRLSFTHQRIIELADRVTRFSIGGIMGMAARRQAAQTGRQAIAPRPSGARGRRGARS
jgi:AcrR family transcriptional regulator